MKKYFTIIVAGLFVLMFSTGAAMAITAVTITSNTIGTAGGGRPALTSINMSPNVDMGYNILADSFAINAVNSKGIIEYGLASDSSEIYFKAVAADSAPSALTQPDSTAFTTGYATLGGS